MPRQYISVVPDNFKNQGYFQFNNIDFTINIPSGKSLVCNSIKLIGDITVKPDGTNELDILTEKVAMDSWTGYHSLFNRATVKMNGVEVENIQDYPRMVKMNTSGSENEADLNSSYSVVEGKGPSFELQQNSLAGNKSGTATDPVNFCVYPEICLNKCSVENNLRLSSKKAQSITISVQMERNSNVFYGTGCQNTLVYTVNNLNCEYELDDDMGDDSPIICTRVMSQSQSVQSSLANLNWKVPMKCYAVSTSLDYQSNQNSYTRNTLDLNKPPNIKEVNFLFDNYQNLITYNLKDNSEILMRYVDSYTDNDGKNSASLMNVNSNHVWGIGLNFDGEYDLSKMKFTLQINSSLQSTNPMTLYAYFKGLLEM